MINKNKKPYWPLCADVFTYKDKLKIAHFLFKEKIWTQGEHIGKYEDMWRQHIKNNTHAIMVSSGSAANELIALRRKHELAQEKGILRNKVVFPVNTWISSVTPWVNMGFVPVFCDVQPNNMCADWSDIEPLLNDPQVGTVFYTPLLGFFGDLFKIREKCLTRNVEFLLDNCEASFSKIQESDGWNTWDVSVNALTTSSTSLFYSHFTTSGTEGGMIFTQDKEKAEWFRMARNHGMTRGMPDKYKNPNVNPDFDFYLMGSNYRSSNLQAYMASLDFNRALNFNAKRRSLLDYFISEIFLIEWTNNRKRKFTHIFNKEKGSVVPLAIPIIAETPELKSKVQGYLKAIGVQTRPIVGGNLLRHTAFKGYGDPSKYPVADHIHHCGLYIGLHSNVTEKMVKKVAREISNL